MEFSISVLEIIITIAVCGNFALQSYWFWTTRISIQITKEPSELVDTKHTAPYLDEEANQSVGSLPEGFIKPSDGL